MFGFRSLFNFLAPHDCLLCGRADAILCELCRPRSAPARLRLDRSRTALAATAYEGVIRQLIHLYKFELVQDAVGPLADLLHEALPVLGPGVLVTYVPTATRRVRSRGYDHARELARAFAGKHRLTVTPLLLRYGQTRQVGAKRQQRLQQLNNAYVVKDWRIVQGADILIIDDIVTTGATLMAAAGVLEQSGAKSVSALVVARKK